MAQKPKRTPRQPKTGPPHPVDTKFFLDRFEAKGLSLRRVAALLNMDHANLSVIIGGKAGRYASVELVCDLARMFGIPVDDVARKLGYDVPRESTARVHVVGLADASGRVEPLAKRGAGGMADRPRGMPDDTVAVRVAAPDGVADGWILYFIPAVTIDPTAVGRLSFCRTADGLEFVGVLGKDRERGRWAVRMLGAGFPNSGLAVKTASPVEWIRT